VSTVALQVLAGAPSVDLDAHRTAVKLKLTLSTAAAPNLASLKEPIFMPVILSHNFREK